MKLATPTSLSPFILKYSTFWGDSSQHAVHSTTQTHPHKQHNAHKTLVSYQMGIVPSGSATLWQIQLNFSSFFMKSLPQTFPTTGTAVSFACIFRASSRPT